jgi:hypothetical protein
MRATFLITVILKLCDMKLVQIYPVDRAACERDSSNFGG